MGNPSAAETPALSLLERLGQQLSTAATAQTVYGTPVEREGITVLPVARARYGFGGGTQTDEATGSGLGAGAGVSLTPVGYIELREGHSRSSVVAVSGVVAWLLLRGVSGLLGRGARDKGIWPYWLAELSVSLKTEHDHQHCNIGDAGRIR